MKTALDKRRRGHKTPIEWSPARWPVAPRHRAVTRISEVNSALSDEAERFRIRARECRDLAARAHTTDWRDTLNEIARDLEQEADHLEQIEQNQRQLPPENSSPRPN